MYKVINTVTNKVMMTGTKRECKDYLAWMRENAESLGIVYSVFCDEVVITKASINPPKE